MQLPSGSQSPLDENSAEIQAARFSNHLGLAEHIAQGFMTRANAAEHDDLLQEARLALHRATESHQSGRGVPFESFAAAVIRNALKDGARKRKRKSEREVMSLDAELSNSEDGCDAASSIGEGFADLRTMVSSLATEKAESRHLLEKAITRLPERHRVLIRQVLAGQNLVQIAETEGVSKQATGKAYHVALAQLKHELHALGVKGLDTRNDVQFATGKVECVLMSGRSNISHEVKGSFVSFPSQPEPWPPQYGSQTVPSNKTASSPAPIDLGFYKRLRIWLKGIV